MLGLRQQIGRDPAGIAGVVGDDQHFGRAGDHVDADLAEHQPLGRGDIGVAGADDLRHRRDRRGAVGERRHRLRAADAVDLGDAAEMRRRQHQRIELAVGRRHHHHHAADARDFRRHRVHQHRGRIGGGAAGNIEPDRLDRAPAPAELDAERIGEALVLRQLPAMKDSRCGRGRISAHRACRASQAFTAASISRRRDAQGRPHRDRAGRISCVASISAASPRAATSSTMARVASSISADTSRFIAEEKRRIARQNRRWCGRGERAWWLSGRGLVRSPLLNGAAANGRQPSALQGIIRVIAGSRP